MQQQNYSLAALAERDAGDPWGKKEKPKESEVPEETPPDKTLEAYRKFKNYRRRQYATS